MDDQIAKELMTKASVIYDNKVLELMNSNNLGEVYKELSSQGKLNGEALAEKGYALLNGRDGTTGKYKLTLTKIIGTIQFSLDVNETVAPPETDTKNSAQPKE
jgi:hypothetical protein